MQAQGTAQAQGRTGLAGPQDACGVQELQWGLEPHVPTCRGWRLLGTRRGRGAWQGERAGTGGGGGGAPAASPAPACLLR